MIMMSNKCFVWFIACLDTENIWLGEIILSLSELLTKIIMITLVMSWRPLEILHDIDVK